MNKKPSKWLERHQNRQKSRRKFPKDQDDLQEPVETIGEAHEQKQEPSSLNYP